MNQKLFPGVVDLNIIKKQKAYYNKRHTSEKYQLCACKNMRNLSGKGGIEYVRWTGPYLIM